VLDLASMAGLPRPSAEQRAAFALHVCGAHSWYKHLSFEESERAAFVVFLAEDAGAGFEERARHHDGWKTTDEYRRRFGLLDYAWRLPGEGGWRRDAGADVAPSPELLAVAGFSLGPLCSNDANAVEVLCLRAEQEPAAPRDALRALDGLRRRADEAYLASTEEERAAFAAIDLGYAPSDAERAALTTERAQRLRDARAALDAAHEALRAPEVLAIEGAIARLLA